MTPQAPSGSTPPIINHLLAHFQSVKVVSLNKLYTVKQDLQNRLSSTKLTPPTTIAYQHLHEAWKYTNNQILLKKQQRNQTIPKHNKLDANNQTDREIYQVHQTAHKRSQDCTANKTIQLLSRNTPPPTSKFNTMQLHNKNSTKLDNQPNKFDLNNRTQPTKQGQPANQENQLPQKHSTTQQQYIVTASSTTLPSSKQQRLSFRQHNSQQKHNTNLNNNCTNNHTHSQLQQQLKHTQCKVSKHQSKTITKIPNKTVPKLRNVPRTQQWFVPTLSATYNISFTSPLHPSVCANKINNHPVIP